MKIIGTSVSDESTKSKAEELTGNTKRKYNRQIDGCQNDSSI
jgi:hypothetical protein